MAFRGDSVRGVTWSDIFLRQVPLVDIGLDYTATVSVVFIHFLKVPYLPLQFNRPLLYILNKGKRTR
jgi:hypothetical protein